MRRNRGLDPNGRLRGARMQADHVPDPERWHGLITRIEELARGGECGAEALVALMLEYHRHHAAHEQSVRAATRAWVEHNIRPSENLAPQEPYYNLALLCRDALIALGPAAARAIESAYPAVEDEAAKAFLRHTLEEVRKAK